MSDFKFNENVAGGSNSVPDIPKFPEGLRVIAVDDDRVSLRTVTVMLEKCKYQVASLTNATEALGLLRKNRESYDLVLTDVRMPDMDGFELLKLIRLEMDIPVIMMSIDGSTENVMKGVRHGARDYLVKPIRIQELNNIWQHVLRKTVLDPEKSSLMTQEIVTGDLPLKKRQGKEKVKEDANPLSDGGSSVKKKRFAWTEELHKKFVDAVEQLDLNKAVPKHIVELMDEPRVTREIVASHLQKYRNFMKKLQDSAEEERRYNAAQIGIHGAFLNQNPSSYIMPLFRDPNNGSSSGIMPYSSGTGTIPYTNTGSSSGIIPYHEHLSRPETLSNSLLNEAYLIGQNQQNFWSQHPPMQNPEQAPRHLSVLGNAPPAQSWVANPSGRVETGNYADLSQLPNVGAVESGPPPGFADFYGRSGLSGFPPCLQPNPQASNPCPPDALGLLGTPYQMLDGASAHMSQSFQSNALPGQHDGRVASTAFNGGLGSEFRSYPVDFQATDNSRANGQGPYMQLLTGNLESNHHNSLSSTEDEPSAEEKQVGPSTSAPME